MRILRRSGLAFVVLLSLAALGCGGAGGPAGEEGSSQQAEGAPTYATQGGKSKAIASPIRIQRHNEDGQPLEEIKKEIEAEIAAACGGTLCVRVRVEHRDLEGYTACQFQSTEPVTGEDVPLPRESTLVIVSGSEPCETEPTTGATEPTTGATEPTAAEQPPPST